MSAGGFAPSLHRSARAAVSTPTTLRVDAFAAAGTWSRPTLGTFWGLSGNINRVRVKLWGAGGGGTTATAAGGGGAFAQADDLDVSASSSYAIAGIAGGAANTNAADTTFGGTLVVAKGGLSGGNGGTGGLASACTGDTKYSGGDGAAGAAQTSSGAGAGSEGNASGFTPGEPDGGAGAASAAGPWYGAGGTSAAATQSAGGRGGASVEYYVAATAGYARWQGYKLSRSATGTSHVAAMPAGIQAGDLLLLIVGMDGTGTISVSGWTQLADRLETNNATRGAVWYRVATGSGDDATVTTSTSTRGNMAVLRFQGAGTPECTIADGNGTNANSSTHTSSAGVVKGIWISAVCWDANANMTLSGPPTGFTNWVASSAANASASRLSFSMLHSEASAVDPANYASGSEQWVASTILIPPA